MTSLVAVFTNVMYVCCSFVVVESTIYEAQSYHGLTCSSSGLISLNFEVIIVSKRVEAMRECSWILSMCCLLLYSAWSFSLNLVKVCGILIVFTQQCII